jgi:hypothetical protein
MKNYIMTTTTFVDEFGLLEEPDVNNDKYQRTINSDKVYYGIARTLVNQEFKKQCSMYLETLKRVMKMHLLFMIG